MGGQGNSRPASQSKDIKEGNATFPPQSLHALQDTKSTCLSSPAVRFPALRTVALLIAVAPPTDGSREGDRNDRRRRAEAASEPKAGLHGRSASYITDGL